MYTVWIGGPHNLAGVECIDCHGYDITQGAQQLEFLNHTFTVKPDLACGQSEDCHYDPLNPGAMEAWALGQLEMIEHAFDALTDEIEAEASTFGAIVLAYNATAGADHDLANTVYAAVENAEFWVDYYEADGSYGFHYPHLTFEELNAAYAEMLDAKAYFYEMMPADAVTVTVTVTNTVTNTVTVLGGDSLLLVGGSVGGIVIGLVLGILVGRRR
jgi:formate-dependent nitrite reductase cytochrome c552 subunit